MSVAHTPSYNALHPAFRFGVGRPEAMMRAARSMITSRIPGFLIYCRAFVNQANGPKSPDGFWNRASAASSSAMVSGSAERCDARIRDEP